VESDNETSLRSGVSSSSEDDEAGEHCEAGEALIPQGQEGELAPWAYF
jgi:hypothetical protein